MLVELPIVLIITSLVGGLFFIAGSSVSPINKHLKTHIRFLEGKVNRYKQDEKEAKIENKDGIDEIIDSNPMIKTVVQSLGGKEKAMEWVYEIAEGTSAATEVQELMQQGLSRKEAEKESKLARSKQPKKQALSETGKALVVVKKGKQNLGTDKSGAEQQASMEEESGLTDVDETLRCP